MNIEEKLYKKAELLFLNSTALRTDENIIKNQIEICEKYIMTHQNIVNKLRPKDFPMEKTTNVLNKWLEGIEKECNEFMDSEQYKVFCNSLTKLDRWESLKLKFKNNLN